MASVIVYMARRMDVDVNNEMTDEQIRAKLYSKIYFDLDLTEEDIAIDGYEIEED